MKYSYEQTRNDYLSPPDLVSKALKRFNVDIFSTDVCCSKKNIPALEYFINGEKDGLKEDWGCFNWCNPPYNECEKWVKKAHEEQLNGNITIMLIPVRTETKYWHKYILHNEDVIVDYLRKGPRFLNPETNEPLGVFKNALALVYFM